MAIKKGYATQTFITLFSNKYLSGEQNAKTNTACFYLRWLRLTRVLERLWYFIFCFQLRYVMKIVDNWFFYLSAFLLMFICLGKIFSCYIHRKIIIFPLEPSCMTSFKKNIWYLMTHCIQLRT